jgi:hypothetical protein
MKTDTSLAKFIAISHQVSPAPLLNVSASSFHRALADKSGIIGTQMGQTVVSVQRDALYDTIL